MLPVITELEVDIEEVEDIAEMGKSFLFDFSTNEFVLEDGKMIELTGIDALKMWIEKVIRTEKERFEIYSATDYGVTIEDLIGTNYPRNFVESELRREITESLLLHPYIQEIQGWTFSKEATSTLMSITFEVVTVDGAFEQEVTLNV